MVYSIVPGLVEAPASTTAEAFRAAYFDAVSEDDFDRTFRTKAVGAYWLTFAFLPLLEKWKSAPGTARFAPQVIMTTSMNGWTKVSLACSSLVSSTLANSHISHRTRTLQEDLSRTCSPKPHSDRRLER